MNANDKDNIFFRYLLMPFFSKESWELRNSWPSGETVRNLRLNYGNLTIMHYNPSEITEKKINVLNNLFQ